MTHWAILTGEYPPQPGGVSDYTRLVAEGLATAGDQVMVYAPPCSEVEGACAGVSVVRLPDHFGRQGRAEAAEHLARVRPDRILVQYVPHAFGLKAMNLPFARWIQGDLPKLAPVWVMFHEVAYPFVRRPLKHNLIALANRVMARLIATAAERVFVSIPAWGELLRRIAPRSRPAEWLPVPPTLPTHVGVEEVTAVRRSLPVGPIIGHFGTYGELITVLLEPALAAVLQAGSDRSALLVGRNSKVFQQKLIARNPDLAGRVLATGDLSPEAAATHISACDLMLQPYPDGVSCRRTSVMCGFALGVPVVTNLGTLSEPFWTSISRGISLAPSPSVDDLIERSENLLQSGCLTPGGPVRTVPDWFTEGFGLERTIATLRTTGVNLSPYSSGGI